ncbi:MAG: hypothetical protein FWD34_06040 [Oscillospiraceae bacterium]|nr:hypothetical protein [Oscillospiraceae bacterium]
MAAPINPTPYSNAVNAYTANKRPTLEQMQERANNPSLILNFDTFEMGKITLLSDEEMQKHIEESRQIPIKHQQFFNTALTVEDTFTLYEKGREDILKTYAGDNMLQVHLDVFDNAFANHLRFLACNSVMVLRNQQSMYEHTNKQGYEYNRIATHADFNGDAFQKNVTNLMSQFATSFIQQIKEGVDYETAQKTATQYMTAAFPTTTSVNNLSFGDFSVYLKTITTENDQFGLDPHVWGNFHTGLSGEKNKLFNDSPEISKELQVILNQKPNKVFTITLDAVRHDEYVKRTHSFTYEKLDNSYLRNIHDSKTLGDPDFLRYSYYVVLFSIKDHNQVNANLDKGWYNAGGYGQGSLQPFTVEAAMSKYMELRDEVFKAFGHDENLLNKNLDTLDKAFENRLHVLGVGVAQSAGISGDYAEYSQEHGNDYEAHALFSNVNFNQNAFQNNVAELMRELAQAFLNSIRSGIDYADAQKSAFEYMLEAFNKTTSVNNLSFADFLVVMKYSNLDEQYNNSHETLFMTRSEVHKGYNQSTQISEELREMLKLS